LSGAHCRRGRPRCGRAVDPQAEQAPGESTRSVGLAFSGETLPSDWVLADCSPAGLPLSESEMAGYWHQDGVFAVVPISARRFRIIADVPASKAGHPATPTLERCAARLSEVSGETHT
jgi:hypothetical protein